MSRVNLLPLHFTSFQVVVHGIPFKYSWKELKDLFNEKSGGAQHADVVIGRDGRSKVGSRSTNVLYQVEQFAFLKFLKFCCLNSALPTIC